MDVNALFASKTAEHAAVAAETAEALAAPFAGLVSASGRAGR